MSVYTGSLLEEVLSKFKNEGLTADHTEDKEIIDLQLSKIPEIKKDYTDRNRTSPFPFVDNRFECRAVGASANCAALMTVLNTIVANQLQVFAEEVDRRNQQNPSTEDNIIAELQGYMDDVEAVVFNGNGYSKAWEKKAEARGLSNNKTTPAALKAMISESSQEARDPRADARDPSPDALLGHARSRAGLPVPVSRAAAELPPHLDRGRRRALGKARSGGRDERPRLAL